MTQFDHDFSYLIEKIERAQFKEEPFRHIYLEDFFSPEHFNAITASAEINTPPAQNDAELLNLLKKNGFKPIPFPGCVTNTDEYIEWHEAGKPSKHHSACEGFGMALRLFEFQSQILEEVNRFLASESFNRAIARKFGVDFDACVLDGGIQKYLDGYEISPHPDIRKKAATFMVNINPSDQSEDIDYHTHYLKFDPAHEYVEAFWKGNQSIDRAWVPWDWAVSVKQQTKNNSIVLFSPSDDSLHGVKVHYDHLATQRTQLYGNLWYETDPAQSRIEWEELDLSAAAARLGQAPKLSAMARVRKTVASAMPTAMKGTIKKMVRRPALDPDIGQRNV